MGGAVSARRRGKERNDLYLIGSSAAIHEVPQAKSEDSRRAFQESMHEMKKAVKEANSGDLPEYSATAETEVFSPSSSPAKPGATTAEFSQLFDDS